MGLRTKLFWISIVYFVEGLPFGVAWKVWPVYFRVHGVSLAEIGLMSLLSLPWTWKMLWAPLVDRYGSRQGWVAACLGVLTGATVASSLLNPGDLSVLLWLLLLLFTTASATQDIAIDAYAVDLSTPQEAGAINGVRVAAYRIAMVAAGGGMLVAADFLGWGPVWWGLAVLFLALALVTLLSPRVPLDPERRRQGFRHLKAWILRREMLPVVAFVLLYKLGDSTLGRMVEPFWVDRGLSLSEIGLISTTLGTVLVVLGALAGGWFTTRYGIFRGLLWLGVAQAASNLGYVVVAALDLPRQSIYGASIVESFCQGLGTAAFLAFLMNLCQREQAATQFALLSALFSFSRDLAGAFSGWGAEFLGYAPYFALTTVVAVLGLGFLPWVRGQIREEPAPQGAN